MEPGLDHRVWRVKQHVQALLDTRTLKKRKFLQPGLTAPVHGNDSYHERVPSSDEQRYGLTLKIVPFPADPPFLVTP